MDKRTRVGRVYRTIKADLIAHCGGNPSVAKRVLIENVALLETRVHLVSERILTGEELPAGEGEKLISWMNAILSHMRALGLEATLKDVTPSLAEIVAEAAKHEAVA
jgi:hypothetical protein